MKKTSKEFFKWKHILVVDDNKIITQKFDLDNDEKLINPITRQKKRKSLYKNINIKIDDSMNDRKKPNLIFVQHEIFSLSNIKDDDNNNNKDDYIFKEHPNLINTDLVKKNEMNQDQNATKLKNFKDNSNGNLFYSNCFTESDSESIYFQSDFEL